MIQKIGYLHFLVRASPHSNPILVHADRVKHMRVNDQLVSFNPEVGKYFPFQKDNDLDEPTNGLVKHYYADLNFGDG